MFTGTKYRLFITTANFFRGENVIFHWGKHRCSASGTDSISSGIPRFLLGKGCLGAALPPVKGWCIAGLQECSPARFFMIFIGENQFSPMKTTVKQGFSPPTVHRSVCLHKASRWDAGAVLPMKMGLLWLREFRTLVILLSGSRAMARTAEYPGEERI